MQSEQLGTGHAVKCCVENFKAELKSSSSAASRSGSPCLVLCGDGPLIRPATLNRLLDRHREAHAAASIATAVLDDATGYGRIYRDAARKFKAIVEQKNCTPEQLKIREVNPSYYCFDLPELFRPLDRVKRTRSAASTTSPIRSSSFSPMAVRSKSSKRSRRKMSSPSTLPTTSRRSIRSTVRGPRSRASA